MSADPVFAATPFGTQAQISSANANRDGSGSIQTVLDATGAGILRRIDIQAVGTTTAGMVRLYLSFDGGTTKRLWREIPIPAVTPSASQDGVFRSVWCDDLPIPDTNFFVYASTHNAETFNVFAFGAYS